MSTAPCNERSELFDSVDLHDHFRARNICATCPTLAECFAACRSAVLTSIYGYGPRGTWAGELMTDDRVRRMQAAMREKKDA